MNQFTDEEISLIDAYIAKYIGTKNNPLNGLTFKEILQLAKSTN